MITIRPRNETRLTKRILSGSTIRPASTPIIGNHGITISTPVTLPVNASGINERANREVTSSPFHDHYNGLLSE